jgi:exodeoxyribonuclease-3
VAAHRRFAAALRSMKIATFNINGIARRLDNLLAWLAATSPEVVCLQELKVDPKSFPHAALQKAGYGGAWTAEGAYNGVAILTKGKEPIVTRRALPGATDDVQCRYIEAAVGGVLVACLYAPNGNPQPGPRFDYKLRWMQRLHEHARAMSEANVPVVLAGDFNVVPTEQDMYPSKSSWKNDALVQPEPRAAYQRLLALGYRDAFRACHPQPDATHYTFWDYKRDGWRRGHGLRIDHLLLSPALHERLRDASVDTQVRGLEGASDHAPVWLTLTEA